VHASKPSTWEAKAGGLGVLGQPGYIVRTPSPISLSLTHTDKA
jgi:hypothetical protein